MCRGSAARTLYEAETLEQQTMHLHKCDHVFFYLGKKSGGVVRLTAKPRYLLLLHRGEKKSNTVTALLLYPLNPFKVADLFEVVLAFQDRKTRSL